MSLKLRRRVSKRGGGWNKVCVMAPSTWEALNKCQLLKSLINSVWGFQLMKTKKRQADFIILVSWCWKSYQNFDESCLREKSLNKREK